MKKQLYIAWMLPLLVACSQEETTPQVMSGQPLEIRLSSQVFDANVSTRAKTTLQPQKIDKGMQVGVYIYDDASPVTAYSQGYAKENLQYESQGDNTLTIGQPYYFPNDDNGIRIFAVAPYQGTSWKIGDGQENTFSVQTEQADSAHYVASDLMSGAAANPVARTKAAIPITFNHNLTKVTVKMVATEGGGMEESMGTIDGVYIMNTCPTGIITMSDSVIGSVVPTGDVETIHCGTSKADCSAIVIPQTVAKGTQLLKITTNTSGTFNYILPANGQDLTLEPMKEYVFTVSLSLFGITVTTSVNNWTPVQRSGQVIL